MRIRATLCSPLLHIMCLVLQSSTTRAVVWASNPVLHGNDNFLSLFTLVVPHTPALRWKGSTTKLSSALNVCAFLWKTGFFGSFPFMDVMLSTSTHTASFARLTPQADIMRIEKSEAFFRSLHLKGGVVRHARRASTCFRPRFPCNNVFSLCARCRWSLCTRKSGKCKNKNQGSSMEQRKRRMNDGGDDCGKASHNERRQLNIELDQWDVGMSSLLTWFSGVDWISRNSKAATVQLSFRAFFYAIIDR